MKSRRKKTKMMRCSQVFQIRMLTMKNLNPLIKCKSKIMTSPNLINSIMSIRRKMLKSTWMVISRALYKPMVLVIKKPKLSKEKAKIKI